MAKKQYTPEEYKAKLEKRVEKRKRFSTTFLKVFAFALAIAIVYSSSVIAYTRLGLYGLNASNSVVSGNQSTNNDYVDNSTGDLNNDNTNNDVQAPSTDNSGDSSDNTTNNNSNTNNNNSNNNTNNQDKPSADSSKADQEYLDMYKRAVANARANAKSVVRVKDGAINYKGIVEAGGLGDAAKSLMGMFMAADENAIEVKNEAWEKDKLPNASALTLNGVQKITREDKGSTYVITVVAKDETNPKANGDGVGAIAGVIEESQITGSISSVPGLKLSNINIAYEKVTAVATIDKATGNLIALDLNAPCVLGLDAKLLVVSVPNAKVGIQVITEYKIEY